MKEVETWVQEGIDWLEAHPDESKETYDEKQKLYEDKIRPVMMKLYNDSGMGSQESATASPPKGPSVEEVD